MMAKSQIDVWCWTCDGAGEMLVPHRTPSGIKYVWVPCKSCHGSGKRKPRSLSSPGGRAVSDDAQATLDLDGA